MAQKGKNSSETTKGSTKKTGKLSRRAMLSVLGTGLVASGFRHAKGAARMPDPTPTPPIQIMSFDRTVPVVVGSGKSFKVQPSAGKKKDAEDGFYIQVTCKDGNVEAICDIKPF